MECFCIILPVLLVPDKKLTGMFVNGLLKWNPSIAADKPTEAFVALYITFIWFIIFLLHEINK